MSIDQLTIQTLRQCSDMGIALVFNTARPLNMVPIHIYEVFSKDYWVFSNGTTCQKEEEILFHITMCGDQINPILQRLYEV